MGQAKDYSIVVLLDTSHQTAAFRNFVGSVNKVNPPMGNQTTSLIFKFGGVERLLLRIEDG
jgi:hypothetical protein